MSDFTPDYIANLRESKSKSSYNLTGVTVLKQRPKLLSKCPRFSYCDGVVKSLVEVLIHHLVLVITVKVLLFVIR